MKKYLSCIILIVACIVCATIFYVKALDVGEKNESTVQSTMNVTNDKNNVQKNEPKITINQSGTIRSPYLSPVNLRIEWAAYKTDKDPMLYLSAELYLDTPEQITNAGKGYLTVNGEKREFTTKTMVGTSNLISSYSVALEYTKDCKIVFDAFLDIDSTTASGDKLTSVCAKGEIFPKEEFVNMPTSSYIDLQLVSKFPELPSGDEITSLCMILKYLKYDVDKCDLSDLYLDKGPAFHTDIFEANAGNPKDSYNSYGCMPPVIVNAANKYIGLNGGKHYAQDFSGKGFDALLYEVWQGNPIIVWVCEEFESTPSVFRTLIINGKTIHLKSNINTCVLIGYDFEKGTVTLANPSGNVFDVDMELFAMRYSQVGSYSVLIK